MQQYNLQALFDERQLIADDRQFLEQKELRIKSIMMQSAIEVGGELVQVRGRLHYKHGQHSFEAWVNDKFGFSRDKAYQLIDTYEGLKSVDNYQQILDFSFNAQLQLAKAPDPQSAVDEALLRKQIEGEITAKKAKEIADYQRAENITRDELRSVQERADAREYQLSRIKQQLTDAQYKLETMQKPEVIEKKVEVVPQSLKDRINQLQERQKQLERERNSYRKQLDEERSVSYAHQTESREGVRIRAMFAERTRDIQKSIQVYRSCLPSFSETNEFSPEDWQRLDETVEKMEQLIREIHALKQGTSPKTLPFIIDSSFAG